MASGGDPTDVRCFHCAERVPDGETRTVPVNGVEQPVCCAGCQAVASMILGAGLDDFYRFRERAAEGPEAVPGQEPDRWAVYDEPEVREELCESHPDGQSGVALLIEGLYCAACGWLIEKVLSQSDAVTEVHVNPATGRARVHWDAERLPLSGLLAEIERIGYQPHPLRQGEAAEVARRERRRGLRRLLVAGLGMMQVMMFTLPLYAGEWYGMDDVYRELLRWVALIIATPVVLYAGFPFFHGFWRDVRARSPGMDVPVALAIGSAFAASVYMTLTAGEEVYFDSVTMFTFLLLTARFVEMSARHRSAETIDALAALAPSTAVRVEDGGERIVATRALRVGDRIRIREGDRIPTDARVLDGEAWVDESMLTGEARLQRRGPGSNLVGGSVAGVGGVRAEVTAIGAGTVLAALSRMLERAQSERPRIARWSDWVARRFVVVVLALAAVVFVVWMQLAPDRAFLILLAVLIATCPCALAMATPMALAGGTARMASQGLLVSDRDAVERLAGITRVVLDKTGTLTHGTLEIDRVVGGDFNGPGVDAHTDAPGSAPHHQAVAWALALERHSSHPIAGALAGLAARWQCDGDVPEAAAVEHVEGKGLTGTVAGRQLRLGRPGFAAPESALAGSLEHDPDAGWVVLAEVDGPPLAAFRLEERIRDDAGALVAGLQARGYGVEIASGDASGPVERLAGRLGIAEWRARMRPEDKLARIHALQASGERVLMVGDGVNDAPVLAGADVSAALSPGTALAQNSAGLIILGERLQPLIDGLESARWTLRVMKQNLTLSVGYNFSALPLAAVGLLTPWMGALGMTASSLLVVFNASRLHRPGRGVGRQTGRQDGSVPAPAGEAS